jgi:hypothetical protein
MNEKSNKKFWKVSTFPIFLQVFESIWLDLQDLIGIN